MRIGLALLAAAVLVGRASAADEGTPLSVERIWGGKPITTPLPGWSWRPGTSQLVRVDAREGARVLVAMDPESGKESDLLDLRSLEALVEPNAGTRPEGIGRRDAPEFLWSADGGALCALVKGDLVWVDLATGTRCRLTNTTAPIQDVRVAPDGKRVSFSRGHDLWVVPTSGGEERRRTEGGSEDVLNATLDWVYPEEFGHDTAAWWSPDGARIAYLQLVETGVTRFPLPSSLGRLGDVSYVRYPKAGDRNPVARVGVVPASGGETAATTTWLDLGTPAPEYVVRVAWFPDGKRVGVVTLDRAQRRLRLLACDAATGASAALLEETDPAWIDPPSAPRFLDGSTFLWESHRDGETAWWLGRVEPGATAARLERLTPPAMDVESLLDFDRSRSAALFLGTAHGARRTSAYVSAPAADGAAGTAVRLLPAPFVRPEDAAVDAAVETRAGLALVTTSGAITPPRVELRRIADGSLVRALGDARSAEFDALRMPEIEYGDLETPDGRFPWRLWRPAALEPGKRYPVVVQVYGGPGSRMVRDEWRRGPFLEALLVDHGFLVFELDGRGTRGRGTRFERTVQGRLGLPELADQVRGVEMLRERPYVDGGRVGIWGWSYGGTMVCNALCTRSDVFRAGVAVAPVTDWRYYDTIYTERYMGLPTENPKGYAETSCLRAASKMSGRLLLAHGMADDNVHVQNSFRLIDALLSAGKTNFEAMIYPDAGHGISGKHVDLFGRLLRFFEHSL